MTDYEQIAAKCEEKGIACILEARLAPYTTFRIGGPCGCLAEPGDVDSIAFLLKEAYSRMVPVRVIGKGSNLLISDEGIRACMIYLGPRFAKIERMADNILRCEAGASLASVCRFAAREGLSGMEFAYGIPGSIGGAAYMNAGAYGGEMADILLKCEDLDRTGQTGEVLRQNMALSYRHSIYMESDRVITNVYLRLRPGDPETIQQQMEMFLQKRKEKQPLEYPSAGSTFKRPEGAYASALIESCGLKGLSVGGAQVSTKHSGFIINTGNATCTDVLALIEQVQKRVKEQTGFWLEPEVEIF
ncbi:MAG TPA: UDP-N-acetylmuramate dehydrogenase [Firmicutes bacterium]|nr:UDP-N-acetylmuramate dehydrogenase [Bacillota bacterium]